MIQFQFRNSFVAAAVAAASVATLTACGGDGAGASGGDSNFVQGTGEITQVPVGDREPAPDISGETLDGERISLSDFRGEVVVVNVWGSWCPPCRAEAPHFVEVAEETADEGVSFVGINTRDRDTGPALAYEREFGVTYPSFYDPSGRLLLEFPPGSLNPQAIPSTLVIDREGGIAARALTQLSADELRDTLRPVLAEG